MIKKNDFIFIQARLTSKRYPRKIFEKINDQSMIFFLYKRLIKVISEKNIVFVIPKNKKNEELYQFFKKNNILCFRGSENNVLKRFYEAALYFKANNIIRVTSDCPLTDPNLIKTMYKKFIKFKKVDYYSNTHQQGFPDGFDVEMFNIKGLALSLKLTKNKYHLEHVTTFLRKSKKLNKKSFKLKDNFIYPKLSVDTKKDLNRIKFIIKNLDKDNFSYKDILNKLKFLKKQFLSNKNILKNKTKKSQILWNVAKKKIAGGNMLLSKNPDRHLPNFWPVYFKSAKGNLIKDYDNNIFQDFYLMGVGTNILGYSNNVVDRAVKKSINSGNISSLNSYEELKLAEYLLDFHKEFEMVKFTKTGGEANALAVRLARAYSGKDKIAFCGYHGWHDWYLAANINNFNSKKNLDNHLMKGLETKGVPRNLKNTSFPFNYSDKESFNNIIKNHDIGTVKMEVCRSSMPDIEFLRHVRRETKKRNIILIFDECTTGFRHEFGGIYKSTGIKPDIVLYGKAIGNGYPITCVMGKKDIMKCSDRSFISSTFWSDRVGYVAAQKTLEEMYKNKSWRKIKQNGIFIQNQWKKLFDYFDISCSVKGIPGLPIFKFSHNHNLFRTYISQEMLKNNILAGDKIYISLSHDKEKILKYLYEFTKVLKKISLIDMYDEKINKYLLTSAAKKDFGRLN